MKVLLVDDHALFRAGLRLLLGSLWPGVCVIEADTIAQAIEQARQHQDLDLCLLDLALRGDHGLDALQTIRQHAPAVAVVVVSAADDLATIRACLDAGAMSFIAKSAPPETLTIALKRVLEGSVYLPPEIAAGAALTHAAGPSLTPRQFDVLRCLSRGLPTKLIARDLGLSEHTVKEYIAGLFQALGVHNRTEAVIKASRLNIGTGMQAQRPAR